MNAPADYRLPELRASKCPCGHPKCSSGNISPVTYGQGVMTMEDAQEIAKRANLFPRMLLALKKANEIKSPSLKRLHLERIVADAERVSAP